MSAPVISPITSVNALSAGQFWKFQPALTSGVAYKWTASPLPSGLSIASSSTFTVDATANTFATSLSLPVGTRVNMVSTSALPGALPSMTDCWVIAGNQLSLTPGGSAIDITGTGTGTHYIWNADTLGLISGFPTDLGTDDVYNVTLYAYDISAGASASMVFPIGVFSTGESLDPSIQLNMDFGTNLASNPATASASSSSGSSSSTTGTAAAPAATAPSFDVWLGNTNKANFVIGCFKGSNQLDLGQPSAVLLTIKHAATQDIMVQGGGPSLKLGSGDTTLYKIFVDCTAVQPVSLNDELSGDDDDDDDDTGIWIDCLLQISVSYLDANPSGGDPQINTRTSQWLACRMGKDFTSS